jgi:putative MATE family efflux protein
MSSKDESIVDDLNISSVAENSKKNLEKKKRKGNIKPSKKKVDMTEGPFLKKMIFFAIPLIFTGVLQWFYNAADLVVVNVFSKSEAPLVGAISCTSALTNLVLGMFMGLSVGAGVLVAHYVGAKKKRDVNITLHTAILLSVISGVIIGVLGFIFAEDMLILMKTDTDLLPYATLYLKIIFLGTPGSLLYNYIASMLRSAGDSKRPLIFLAISGIVNVLLNIFLVTVFKLDVAGVAIATITSQYASAIMGIVYLKRCRGMLYFSFKRLKIDVQKLKKLLYIGIPSGIQGSLFSLSNTFIQRSMNIIDANAAAGGFMVEGYGASSNLENFIYIVMHSIYSVSLTFVGQNVGAKKYKNIKKLTGYSVAIVLVLGITIGVIMMILKKPLLSLYISDNNVSLAAAITRFSIIIPTYFLCGVMDTLCGSLRALGRSVTSMIISLACVCGVRILWIHTVFEFFETGESLFISYPVSWILSCVIHLVFIIIATKKLLKKQQNELIS